MKHAYNISIIILISHTQDKTNLHSFQLASFCCDHWKCIWSVKIQLQTLKKSFYDLIHDRVFVFQFSILLNNFVKLISDVLFLFWWFTIIVLLSSKRIAFENIQEVVKKLFLQFCKNSSWLVEFYQPKVLSGKDMWIICYISIG